MRDSGVDFQPQQVITRFCERFAVTVSAVASLNNDNCFVERECFLAGKELLMRLAKENGHLKEAVKNRQEILHRIFHI